MKNNEVDIENLREIILLSDSKVWGIVSQKKGVGKTFIAKKLVDCLQNAGKTTLYLKYGSRDKDSVSLEEEIRTLFDSSENKKETKNKNVFMSDSAQIERMAYDKSFEKLIDVYKRKFDYVIVDMMSLEENSIAKRLCSICDNNLFVITKNVQNGVELHKVIDQLQDINVRIGGIVMNEYCKKRNWLRA